MFFKKRFRYVSTPPVTYQQDLQPRSSADSNTLGGSTESPGIPSGVSALTRQVTNRLSSRQLQQRLGDHASQYVSEAGLRCCMLFCTILFYIIYLGIDVAGIVIAVRAQARPCPSEQPGLAFHLSTWLIVASVVAFASVICNFMVNCLNGQDQKDQTGTFFNKCLSCFSLAWLIVGSVYVYGLSYAHPTCDSLLYYFCFYLISISWGLLGLIVFVAFCLVCCSLCIE